MKKTNQQRRKTHPSKNESHPFARFEKKKPQKVTKRKPEKKREKPPIYKKKKTTPTNSSSFSSSYPYPLNKYLAHCGVCARRKAIDHIKAGEVKVNNKIILEPGFKVMPKDKVTFKNKGIHIQRKQEYILLNKPKDCLTTTKDPRGRRTIMSCIVGATVERVYPVGRLDRNTSGLLLITNDGDLAQHLSHPSGEIEKVYHVTLDKPLTKKDFEHIVSGLTLEDGDITVDALAYVETEDHTQVGLEIHSGRNRIVRRIFEQLGYDVKALDRVIYAGLTKKNLSRGKWRNLTDKEVRILKHFRKRKKKTAKKS